MSKFVKSHNRVLLGRETLCTQHYRGGSFKDNFVLSRYQENGHLVTRPASIDALFEIECEFEEEGGHVATAEMMFTRLKFFARHPEEDFYGERSPMKMWSTEISMIKLVPINFIQRKVSVTKAKAYFEHTVVTNNKRSRMRGSDVVLYVI